MDQPGCPQRTATNSSAFRYPAPEALSGGEPGRQSAERLMGRSLSDDVVAAAMIDRLVHHADVLSMKGDGYRLKDRDLGRVPAATTTIET